MVMEIIHLKKNQTYMLDNSVIAIGYFDGLHLGHMQLIDEVKAINQKTGLKKGIMTFDKHPKVVFGQNDFQYLMSLEEKIRMIEQMSFDYFFIIDFDEEVAQYQPETFISKYIVQNHIQYIVCGFDFHFGNQGKGNGHTLEQLSKNNYQVKIIKKYEIDHKKVSSSIIRNYIHAGEIEKANQLLNRPYRITGKVIHGKKNGHKIGFPTANVEVGQYVVLKRGVYAVYINVKGKRLKGMANIGINPTFGLLNKISLEVHIFDFDEDIYGENVDVDFICYIRKETHFHTIDELITQLNKDKKDIIQILE